jgi:hypothetical protein
MPFPTQIFGNIEHFSDYERRSRINVEIQIYPYAGMKLIVGLGHAIYYEDNGDSAMSQAHASMT